MILSKQILNNVKIYQKGNNKCMTFIYYEDYYSRSKLFVLRYWLTFFRPIWGSAQSSNDFIVNLKLISINEKINCNNIINIITENQKQKWTQIWTLWYTSAVYINLRTEKIADNVIIWSWYLLEICITTEITKCYI